MLLRQFVVFVYFFITEIIVTVQHKLNITNKISEKEKDGIPYFEHYVSKSYLYPLSLLDQYMNLFSSLMQTVTIINGENIHRYAAIGKKLN